MPRRWESSSKAVRLWRRGARRTPSIRSCSPSSAPRAMRCVGTMLGQMSWSTCLRIAPHRYVASLIWRTLRSLSLSSTTSGLRCSVSWLRALSLPTSSRRSSAPTSFSSVATEAGTCACCTSSAVSTCRTRLRARFFWSTVSRRSRSQGIRASTESRRSPVRRRISLR